MSEPGKGRERRRGVREKTKLQARFGPGDLANSGMTRDFSDRGLCLQAATLYPPGTILVMKIDLPDGPATFRGVVRWSRDPSAFFRPTLSGRNLPAALRKNTPGGMGVEFLEALQAEAEAPAVPKAVPTPPVRPRKGVPPDASEEALRKVPTRRRQISTLAGNTFEVYETEHRGALYVRIVQLPMTDGSHAAAFQEAFWTREEADAAVKAFLKSH
jgi:hypothetical protein